MRVAVHLLAGLFVLVVTAAAAADEPYTLPNTEIVPIAAEANGVDYRLYINTPPDYETSGKRYPVMVTLDADYQFAIAVNHADHLAYRGQAPEMIIVSIAYDRVAQSAEEYRINRTRDYTPAHTEEGGYGPKIQRHSGGGVRFAEFIGEQVLPWLDAHYPTDPDERFFVGHSYGGMFGAWLLLTHPDYFNRYILVSPSLWFNDKMLLSGEAAPAAPLARKTYVYMGVGEWENQPERSYAMVDDLKAFEARLEAIGDEKLVMETRVFEDETHASIFPAAFSTGLRKHHATMGEAGGE